MSYEYKADLPDEDEDEDEDGSYGYGWWHEESLDDDFGWQESLDEDEDLKADEKVLKEMHPEAPKVWVLLIEGNLIGVYTHEGKAFTAAANYYDWEGPEMEQFSTDGLPDEVVIEEAEVE